MVTVFRESPKSNFSQLYNNKIQLISDSKIIKGLIQPEQLLISIPIKQFSTVLSSQKLFKSIPQSIDNFTKKWILYIQAEDIWKSIDEKLKLKISEDQYLGRVLIDSTVEIKKYLEKTNKKYELNSFVWNDIENRTWEENIISIKIEYDNNKEKRKIWNEINCIVKKHDTKKFSIITEIKKL